jgi:MFS transporter, AAHS family, 3-hydroxyphenylpropionic acid transporter
MRRVNLDAQNRLIGRSTIIFCACVALCEGLDLQAAGVAAAGIGAEFKPTPDQFGTFFSASTFGLFLGALIGGRLADSIGRKRVLVTSVGVFGGFSLLTALAWDVPSLVWARLFTGFGLGGALPILIALVSESSSAKNQSVNVAMVYAATPVGGAIASLVSLLIGAPQWRLIFIVGGVLPLLLAPLMAFGLRESIAFQHRGDSAMPRPGSFAAIFAQGRALRTVLLWVSFFLGLLLLYLLLNWLPSLLVSDGLTRLQAAGAQIGFNVSGALAALLISQMLGGRLRNASIVIVFVALPILLVTLAKAPADVGYILLVVCLLGCAVVAAQAFLYAMAPIAYPTSIRGVGVGTAVAVGRIGSIVGPKLGGYLKSAGHGPAQLLMDLLPLVLIGSICALLLAWHTARARAHGA